MRRQRKRQTNVDQLVPVFEILATFAIAANCWFTAADFTTAILILIEITKSFLYGLYRGTSLVFVLTQILAKNCIVLLTYMSALP